MLSPTDASPAAHPAPPASAANAGLQVAAGVIRDTDGRILIAKRPAHVHQGDLWEFPGGKLEPDETIFAALQRELREELDIDTLAAEPLLRIHHSYPDRDVVLHVWEVQRFAGTASGMQGQPIRWVHQDQLPNFPFPAANQPIITAARLPSCYAIVDDEAGDSAGLRAHLEHLVERGIRMVQLRARRLSPSHYGALAEHAADFCRARGVLLLLNAGPDLVLRTGAAGVHLRSERLLALKQRPLEASFWVGASCHSPEELHHAERIGVDFAVLGPVCPTATHPDAPPLGWERFSAWVDTLSIPVYALGGLLPNDVTSARRHGAQGIAGIRGFLNVRTT